MPAKTTNKLKGNPAGHRMVNPHYKEKHTRAWARSQRRKEERRKAQQLREEVNKRLRDIGVPTAWEHAKNKRYLARHGRAA